MWVTLVIILLPVVNDFPGLKDIAEPVFIHAFIAKLSVKTLNKAVLGRRIMYYFSQQVFLTQIHAAQMSFSQT